MAKSEKMMERRNKRRSKIQWKEVSSADRILELTLRIVHIGCVSYLWDFNQLNEVNKVWKTHRDMVQ